MTENPPCARPPSFAFSPGDRGSPSGQVFLCFLHPFSFSPCETSPSSLCALSVSFTSSRFSGWLVAGPPQLDLPVQPLVG